MSCAYGAKPTQWETLFSNHWPVASIGSALSIHVGNCSTRLPPPVAGYYDLEKIYFSSLNFHESPFFLSQTPKPGNHLPQLFKPCILPP